MNVDRLPYPIAVTWTGLRTAEEEGHGERDVFDALVLLHDAILRLVALVAVSDYVRRARDAARPEADELLRSRFLSKPVSLGTWNALAAELLRLHVAAPAAFAVPELVGLWFDGGRRPRPSAHARAIEDFVADRNDWAHVRLTDDRRRAVLERKRPAFERIVDELAFLERYELLLPLRVDRSSEPPRVVEAVRCRGTELAPSELDLTLSGDTAAVEVGDELLLVPDAPGAKALRLFPLLLSDVGRADGADDLLLYDGHLRSRGDGGRSIDRLEYVGAASRKKVRLGRRSPAAELVAGFESRLGPWLERTGDDEVLEPIEDAPGFAAMPALVAEAAAGVLGRDALSAEVARLRDEGGGLLVVVGPPGSGKTAALARVAADPDIGAAAVHLAAPDGGRDDPRLIARSLLAQLASGAGSNASVPDDLAETLKRVHEVLAAAAERGERPVVILDAADEIRPGPGGELASALLPAALPEGALVVVSTRPGEVERALAGRRDASRHELARVSRPDLEALGRRLAPETDGATLRAAAEAADGNPLFLEVILAGDPAASGLPPRIEDAFAKAVEVIEARCPKIDVAEAFGLLALARSGLGRRDLARMLGATPFETGRLLEALGGLVVTRDERHVIFHARLREWVAEEMATPEALPALHGRIAAHLTGGVAAGRDDALRDLPHHLEAAGHADRLRELLDGDFLARKARAGGSPEALRDDLLTGARVLGATDVITAVRYGLTAALIARGARDLGRAGILAALARHGDPRIAAALARSIPAPEERDAALAVIARQAAARDRPWALRLVREIEDDERRATAERALDLDDEEDPRADHELAVRSALDASEWDAPPELRARASACALLVEPRDADAQRLVGATTTVLEAVNRTLRVEVLLAAATGLAPRRCEELARRAAALGLEEPSIDRRAALVIAAVERLALSASQEASEIATRLPPGRHRVRALAAAGDLRAASDEADAIADLAERQAAKVALLEPFADREPAAVVEQALALEEGAERDRVLRRVAARAGPGELGERAARAITDPALLVEALAHVGRWSEAREAADAIDDAEGAARALERLAAAAIRAGEAEHASDARARAEELRSALPSAERARSFREAATIAATDDEAAALDALDRGDALDRSWSGRRDLLLRRARVLLARPSGRHVVDATQLAGSFGDALCDLYAEIVGSLSIVFGERAPEAVEAAVAALEAAIGGATAILTAGMDAIEPPEVTLPERLPEEVASRLANETWNVAEAHAEAARRADLTAEADRLAARLTAGSAEPAEVDRLVELRLELGDRAAAARALRSWSTEMTGRGQDAIARAALERAQAIDPLAPTAAPAPAASPAPAARAARAAPPRFMEIDLDLAASGPPAEDGDGGRRTFVLHEPELTAPSAPDEIAVDEAGARLVIAGVPYPFIFRISSTETVVGRRGVELGIDHPSVAARHAIIRWLGGELVVEPIEDAPVQVDGRDLAPGASAPMRPHGTVAFGDVSALFLMDRHAADGAKVADLDAWRVCDDLVADGLTDRTRAKAAYEHFIGSWTIGEYSSIDALHVSPPSDEATRRGSRAADLAIALILEKQLGPDDWARAYEKAGRPGIPLQREEGSALLVQRAGKLQRRVPHDGGMLSIGSSGSNKLVLDDASVGARHALFMTRDGRETILDLGAPGGTLVNGRAISPKDGPVEVRDGDTVTIGVFTVRWVLGRRVRPAALAANRFATDAPPAAVVAMPAAAPAASAEPTERLGGGTVVMGNIDVQDAMGAAVSVRKAEARLIVALEGRREVFPINGREIKIGREGDNHLNIPHPSISISHAKILWTGEGFSIEDLGSATGTRVDDGPIAPHASRRLRPHAVIRLGDVPCLFLAREPTPWGQREPEADAAQATHYLVRKRWISKRHARGALARAKGDTLALAETLVLTGLISPDQWSEASHSNVELRFANAKRGEGGSSRLAACALLLLILLAAACLVAWIVWRM